MKYTRTPIALAVIFSLLVFVNFVPKAHADVSCSNMSVTASATSPTTIPSGSTVTIGFSFSVQCSGQSYVAFSCSLASAGGNFATMWKSFTRSASKSGTFVTPPLTNSDTLYVHCYDSIGSTNAGASPINVTVSTITPPGPTCSQTYTTPGTFTYTPPPGTTGLRVTSMVGGGGGGGFAGPNYSGSGGGGAQAYKNYDLPSVGPVSVTVGAAGAMGSPGKNGGNSSVTVNGFTLTAYGGKGGGFNTTFTGSPAVCSYSTSSATDGGDGGTDPISTAPAGGRTVVCPSSSVAGMSGEPGQAGTSVSVPAGGPSAVKISGGGGGGGKWYGNFNFAPAYYGSGGQGGSTPGGSGGSASSGTTNSSYPNTNLGWNGGGGASAFGNGGNGGAPSGYTNGPFDTAATGYGAGGAGSGSATGGMVKIDCAAPAPVTTLSVTSTSCSAAGLSWAINPESISGSGTSGSYTVHPVGATQYTITPSVTSGTYNVINSTGGTSVVTLVPGDSESFDITCTPVFSTADIAVTTNLASASWTINPGLLSGSGTSGTYTVNPGATGSLYTISPTNVAGYTYVVSPGTSQFVLPGDTPTFDIDYSPVGAVLKFTLSTSPTFSVPQGGTIQVPITSSHLSGTPEPISFSALGYNSSDITNVSYAPQPCPTPSCVENVTFQVSPTATLGVQHITVSGTSAPSSIKRSVAFDLNIVPASGLSVSCSASPSPALVGQPVTWTSTVTGSVGSPSYIWSGDDIPLSPAPTTAQYVVVYKTVGNKRASVQVTDSVTSQTVSCPNTTLEVRVNPNFKEF